MAANLRIWIACHTVLWQKCVYSCVYNRVTRILHQMNCTLIWVG